MRGIQVRRNASADTSPPGRPSAHGASCPSSHRLGVMNENKGVFGLNMLHWWDAEGGFDRALEPLLEGLEKGDLKPVVAEAFPFDRAADAHQVDKKPSVVNIRRVSMAEITEKQCPC